MIISNNIFSDAQKASPRTREFGELYIALREREKRIYTDDQVAKLPETGADHIHADEWKARKISAGRLVSYLENMNKPLAILEVGCGNGWLSGRLAGIKDSKIRGIDINEKELNQAKRVFGAKTNIQFEIGHLHFLQIKDKFDVIVFAASIQYFPDFRQTIGNALSHLYPGGEIHILDSLFYRKNEIPEAARRSLFYYQGIGFGEMAEWYFHHSTDSLKEFNYKILYDPQLLINRIFHRRNPFPWICIKQL